MSSADITRLLTNRFWCSPRALDGRGSEADTTGRSSREALLVAVSLYSILTGIVLNRSKRGASPLRITSTNRVPREKLATAAPTAIDAARKARSPG